MSVVPPQVNPPQLPSGVPEPDGGFLQLIRDAAALPGRFIRWLGSSIRGLSFAALTSWFIFFALLVIVVVFWFVLRKDGDVPWQQTLTVERLLVGVLVLIIPVVTYKTILNWTTGVTSDFPDIQDAWERGVASLLENNINLQSYPVFLVVGTPDLRQQKMLMKASGLQFVVQSVPSGPAPLHFYATTDSVYVVLSDASWLSGLIRLAGRQTEETQATVAPETPGASPSSAAPDFSKRTMDVATFMDERQHAEMLQASTPVVADQSTLRPGATAYGRGDKPLKLTAQEASDQTNRIRHVGELLRTSRDPLCPVNGVMVLIPFHVLTATDDAAREIQRAINSDLQTLQSATTLKAPIVALFTGLEFEPGFRELVRRVGPVSAARQRFGQGMDVRCRASSAELEALAAHACGAFEDWVYTLFREDGALTRPGNTLLHSLLCLVRSKLKKPIAELLARGFGNAGDDPEADRFFAGCYFAATGSKEEQQAFVRGVFDKLTESQEDLEWTRAAFRRSSQGRVMLATGVAASLVLTVVLAVMIFMQK